MTAPMVSPPSGPAAVEAELGTLSQWQLIRRRFAQHRLAVAALFLLAVLYTMALFAEFFAPHASTWRNFDYVYCPPQLPRFNLTHGLHTDRLVRHTDPITLRAYYVNDATAVVPLGFLVKGDPYRLWGLFECERRFLGVDRERLASRGGGPAEFYLLGADLYGYDIWSRIVYGARISLSIGLTSIIVTFILGITIGGISGYLGGRVDNFLQRAIEIINSFPQLPLWMALGAVMPPRWSPLQTYFAITMVLSLLGWTGLARVVRGKILSLREEDYAVAARLIGASHPRILFRHLVPGFTSHIIVSLTMSIPGMILGETSLSFLGLGLRPPIVSWGVMLQDCMNLQVVANYPWLLMPMLMILLTVLAFNFLGDGLRDAADPYTNP